MICNRALLLDDAKSASLSTVKLSATQRDMYIMQEPTDNEIKQDMELGLYNISMKGSIGAWGVAEAAASVMLHEAARVCFVCLVCAHRCVNMHFPMLCVLSVCAVCAPAATARCRQR